MVMTLIPIAGLVIAFFWCRAKYILTDQKLDEVTASLEERKAAQQ